jgi:hypothetical protein
MKMNSRSEYWLLCLLFAFDCDCDLSYLVEMDEDNYLEVDGWIGGK